MATVLTLPAPLASYLGGSAEPAAEETAIVVCTVDDNGFAHPALLSRGEIRAVNGHSLRLAIGTGSRSAQHARRNGRLTLILVHDGTAYYLKGLAREIARAMRIDAGLAKWHIELTEIRVDRPDPKFDLGAYLVSGITFVNPAARQARSLLVLAELGE